MANLADYHVIDGVTEVLAEHHNSVIDSTIRGELSNIESLAANKTLIDDDFALQVYTPTAARVVTLPAVATTNHPFYIVNSSATYALTVKNAGGTTISIIGVSSAGQFASDGAAWYTIAMPYVAPSTSGNVLKSNGSAWVSSAPLDVETTFTPVITGSTAAGTGTYSTQLGYYSRIGNIVFFTINLAWSAHTGTGNMGISGLPITAGASKGAAVPSIYWSGITLAAVGNKIISAVLPGTTKIILAEIGSGAALNIAIDTAVPSLYLSGFYFL